MKIILPEDKILIRQYLSEYVEREGYIIKSSYFAALQEARSLTGRNANGDVINEESTGCWSGTSVYFILIDHISEFFVEQTFSTNHDRYVNCLEKLGGLIKEEAEIIYKVRNSFLHKFNLYSKNDKYNYVFAVGRDPYSLIDFAKKPWSGDFNDKVTPENQTSISLRKIQDLVEDMNKNLLKRLDDNSFFVNLTQEVALKNFLDFNTIAYKDNK